MPTYSNNNNYYMRNIWGYWYDLIQLFHISDPNFPRVPVIVNAEIITSSSATIQWSFPRLLEMRNEIISIFYGTTSEQLGVIIYSIPSNPDMEQYSIHLMSLQPGTRYVYSIYSSNEFANRTDGVEYDFKTDDNSEFNVIYIHKQY